MKNIIILCVISIVLYSCNTDQKDETYDKNLPWNLLKEKLDDLLIFELDCSTIHYKIDNRKFDEKYVEGWFEFSSEILIENINDSVLINQDFKHLAVPKEWSTGQISSTELNDSCQVYYTKLVESKHKNVIFTYVYIPTLDAKYKILYTKNANNEWNLKGFGM